MFLSEPQRTRYDVHFTLAGFPVRVHPWFWLAGIVLGAGGSSGENAGALMLIWIGVLFFSILIHEMGHALAFRWFRVPSRIILYMFGGITVPETAGKPWGAAPRLHPQAKVIVSLAGPFAGFVLGALVVASMHALGGSIVFNSARFPFFTIHVPAQANFFLWDALGNLLWINIAWGAVNLLPIYPLDGGHVADVFFTAADPYAGHLRTLQISFVTALIIAILGYVQLHSIFMALLFGSLAYSNYMGIRSAGGGPW